MRSLHPLAADAVLDRHAFIRAAASAGAGAAALMACGGSDPKQPAAVAAPTTTTTSPGPTPFDEATPYWLQANYAPVPHTVEAFDLEVVGALPPTLSGLYVRNGSNPANGKSSHWFLGDGMVHGVRLEEGRAAWYRNQWVATPYVTSQSDLLQGGPVPGGPNSPANTSMVVDAGRLFALCEVGFPYELSTTDLSTVGPFDYGGQLNTAMTAHPKRDPVTGRLHFFGYGFVPPFLTYHVVEPDGRLAYSEEIAVAGPTMIHDFAITDRDAIFWELPVVFDIDLALAGEMPFSWDPSYGARIGIMPLAGPTSAIQWVEIEPCYVFHGTNAYRDGDRIVLDVSQMPTAFVHGGEFGPNTLHRWTIDGAGSDLQWSDEEIADHTLELPTIDRRRAGRAHRYGWYTTTRPWGDAFEFGGIARLDTTTGQTEAWDPGPARAGGEWLFVADGPGEDEGWVLAFVYDRTRDGSDLLVLDASDVAAGPVASVRLPQRVPYGFHATWVPD